MTACVNDAGRWYLRCDWCLATNGNADRQSDLDPAAFSWTTMDDGKHYCPRIDRLHPETSTSR